jgi:flagellar FliL protein
MAKDKDDKKSDDKDAKKGDAKAELSPEEAAAKAKKKKLLLLVVGGVVATAGVGGGLAFFLAKGGSQAAKSPHDEHAEAAAPAADAHGDAKADGHGDAKADGHGAAKEGHGDAAKDGHGDAAKKPDPKADPKLAKLEGVDFGCTFPLQPFHLNLGNPLENRYVRLEVAVEYGCAEEIKAEMEKRLPQLRDAIITVTSRKTREFLLGPDGKEQLRKEIQTQLNYHMAHKIDDVYLTDILIE